MFPYPIKSRLKFYNLVLFLLIGGSAFGQLNADFSMDLSVGCSPLIVNFINRTTGASSGAVYKWDFGNGNSSALTKCSAVFTKEQAYTVTLTVQDGSNQSTQTRQVTVSRPPAVDFTVDAAKICLGSSVTFAAKASPGDGNITGYAWDFGDGTTLQGMANSPPHQYGFVQQATVSLTVTNTYGCHTTLSKQNIVNIIPALTAGFTADKRVLCLVSDPVQFTNNSTGPGLLDYLWDFADGSTSTNLNPTHVFSKKGNYSVSLKVHSSEGCTVVSTQTNPLNVANYNSSFSVPSPICVGSNVVFYSQSSPSPDNSSWQVDGITQNYYYYGSLYSTFYTAGNHAITLNNTFGTCPQTATRQVSVKALPVPGAISVDITGKCGSPVAVNFKDNTPGAVQWAWNFSYYSYGPPITSTQQAPSYTYASDGGYWVSLQVTNADGCSSNAALQFVEITRPWVYINAAGPGTLSSCTSLLTNTFVTSSSEALVSAKWNFGDGGTSTDLNPTHTFKNIGLKYTVSLNYTTVNGCTGTTLYTQYTLPPPNPVTVSMSPGNLASCLTPLTATFTINSSNLLTTTNWTLGDGSTSTSPSPTHTYTQIGTYVATLNYVTAAGCTGTAYSNDITIDPKIKLSFTANPNPVCGNNTVFFATASNTPDLSTYNWTFGDGGISYNISPTYQYNAAGDYIVTLYVRNKGGCDTTMKQSITVKPPFPRVTGQSNTCDGTRGEVTFTQSSVQAINLTWTFGDGTTATTPGNQATVKHTYSKSGIYYVTLTAINGSCSVTANDPNPVNVLLKQSPLLTGSQTAICNNAPVDITISRLDANPYQSDIYYYPYYYAGYSISGTQYRDGTAFQGYRTDNYNYRWTTTYNGTLSNFKSGEKDIRFILKSYVFECDDTTNYMPLAIKGATGGFEVVSDHLCYPSPVTLKDTSTSTSNNPILSWQWDFGDGQTLTKTKGGSLTHAYANPGSYLVRMQITDAAGCSPNTPYVQYVTVNGPKASFFPSGTDVHLNTTVYFYNTTNDYGNTNTVYHWDFGDGSISTDHFPYHTYPTPGTYTVTMTADNPSVPCSSTATPVVIIVRNFNSAFSFSSSYITGSCPPLLVSFANTSYNYISVDWDFGDGITAANVNYPSHIYEKPGKYIVTLKVHAYNGIEGKYIDSILIREPVVSLASPPPETCIGNTVTLSSTAKNASSFSWDFGDGSIIPSTSGVAEHPYLTAGTYFATLLMRNDAGCVTDTTLQAPIKIRPDPIITLTPGSPVILCKNATVNLQASGGSVYQWDPVTGLSDPSISNPVASPPSTTDYTLTVKDDIGCPNTAHLTVKVIPPGNLQVSKDDTVCAGESVRLTATGETIYQWIDNTAGLSDTGIPGPVALAPSTSTYTVRGSDAYSCFVDQRSVTITVRPLPTVNAGPDVLVEAGYNTTLDPLVSSDVVSYTWQPARYLSCYDCSAPLSTPLATTRYTVTVKNQYGCKASDTVVIAVDCQESHVRIPNAFTPDGNGENDVFIVKGISIIKHMVIFDRWGEKVYERNDFIAGDRSSCWDGTFKGHKSATGTYVYFVEMECPAGGTFSRQGSFVLVR